jgi:crotonobetainyl-CoA:carnitine CoA-transferase CaiB-like acyl-CoA transferase
MNLYCCIDGQWIACGMAVAQRFWPEFCQVMGLAELEQDPRFATDEKRAAHSTELIALLDRAFALTRGTTGSGSFGRRGSGSRW